MQEEIDIEKCRCSKDDNNLNFCLWPFFRKDLLELQTKVKYHGIPFGMLISNESRTVVEKCKVALGNFVKNWDMLYIHLFTMKKPSCF